MSLLKRILVLALLGFCFSPAFAQRKVSADVEIKQVLKGKVSTITKSVYCANNGRLVIAFHEPEKYFVVANAKGESKMYMPQSNMVFVDNEGLVNSSDELIYIFMSGRSSDLGISREGYRLSATERDGEYIRKTFVCESNGNVPRVIIAFKNFLPVYCEYQNNGGDAVGKTYFSNYQYNSRLTLPTRITNISYSGEKRDSTVTRTVYSNLRIDVDDPNFDFEVPSDAKVSKLPAKAMGK